MNHVIEDPAEKGSKDALRLQATERGASSNAALNMPQLLVSKVSAWSRTCSVCLGLINFTYPTQKMAPGIIFHVAFIYVYSYACSFCMVDYYP